MTQNLAMSYCQEDGKDKYVFVTEGDLSEASKLDIPEEVNRSENWTKGFLSDEGELNWECTCRGSLVSSKCGVEMRNFFQCIHDNMDKEEKFVVCKDQFFDVKACMDKYPEHYTVPGEEDQESESLSLPPVDDDSQTDPSQTISKSSKSDL